MLSAKELEESVGRSTRTILTKLDAGPHELIEDPEIRTVWKEMHAHTSVNTRVFLDAVHAYYQRKFADYERRTNQRHPDYWTLHFLGKVIFYPALADSMDEDISGSITVHEVNEFLRSKPADMICSPVAWIAFWAVGPYKTNVEQYRKIRDLTADLKDMSRQVLPQNARRVKYFAGMTEDLQLISMYTNVLLFWGENGETGSAYVALERLRVVWRDIETARIRANLEQVKYQLRNLDYVSFVLSDRRPEHYIMILIHLLLSRHMEIVKLACTRRISVDEFVDMRSSWKQLFIAFGKRLDILEEIWRQQRLNIADQVHSYGGGLFEDWHARKQALRESQEDAMYDALAQKESVLNPPDEHVLQTSGAVCEGDDTDDMPTQDIDASPFPDSTNTTDEANELLANGLLLFPNPTGPDDDSRLPPDKHSDWEPSAVRKRRAEIAMRKRLENIESKICAMDARFPITDAKLLAIDARFPALEANFPVLHKKLSALEAKFTANEAKFPVLEAKLHAMDEKLTALDAKLSVIEKLLTANCRLHETEPR